MTDPWGYALYHQIDEFLSYLSTFTPNDITEKRISHWWVKVWRKEFNCSVKGLENFEVCEENMTLSWSVIDKLYDAFLPYVIEAVYAVAHAIHNIYFCTEPHGLLPVGNVLTLILLCNR